MRIKFKIRMDDNQGSLKEALDSLADGLPGLRFWDDHLDARWLLS